MLSRNCLDFQFFDEDNNNSLTNSLISLLLKILMAEHKGPFDRFPMESAVAGCAALEGHTDFVDVQ